MDNLSEPSKANAKMLEKILKDYSVEGEIDNESLYESLSRAERKAIKVIDEVNKELNEIAEYTASIINGQEFNPLDNYVHLWVMPKAEESNMAVIDDEVRKIQNNNNPSAKSKTFEERTKGAKALNFNPFGATMRGGRMTLLNYYMTSPIRTANRELNMLVESFEGDAIQKRKIVKGIKGAYDQVVRDVLVNGVATTSMFDEALQYLAKTGYRTMLAGLGRSVFQELPSNAINAIIYAPKEFVKGSKVVMQEDGETKVSAISNLKSTQQQRIYTDALTGVNVDVNLLKDKKGIRGEAMRSNVMNKTKQILDSKYNVAGTGRKLVESLADKLITVPDKLIIERVWWGGFTTQFKKITGKEADIKKIAKNDEQYMRENKEALEKATELADRDSFFTGATDNPFLGILAQTKRPSDSLIKKAYKNFNRFMLRFVLIEYENARTAILNLYKSRELSRVKAAQLLAATTSRMVLYTALGGVVGSTVSALIRQMFGYEVDDEEEDDEKSVTQTVAQSFVSTFVNMVIGRNFGQAFRTIASQTLIEPLNEKYLKDLYSDDFDPYRDAVSFSVIPPKTQEEEYKGRDAFKILVNLTGPYSPMAKTISKSIKVFTRAEPKEEPTKERYSKEEWLMALEFAGYAGLIPFFKDVKKAATDETYKDLRIAKKKTKKNKDYSPSWLREGDK